MDFKVEKEYVFKLLGDEGQSFLIPEYQRPYRWGKDECEALWDDLISLFGDGENIDEYFLGSIVTYQKDDGFEIIDGQQRITTFTLLFRAFYEHFKTEGENVKQDYLNGFGRLVWEYEIDKGLNFNKCHLHSTVATDSDSKTLQNILSDKLMDNQLDSSNYAKNYRFFYDKLTEFKKDRTLQWESFCKMFLQKKLFILFVACDNQYSAMTIFNTLNSRGLPLSNADILKGYIYKNVENKNAFANKWKDIESKVEESKSIKDLDFLFLQYMHIIRAEKEDFNATTQSVLNFFTKKDKAVYYGALDNWLYKDETMPFISNLADFWIKPYEYLNSLANRYMNILNLLENDSWKSFVSYLVWKNRMEFGKDDFNKDNFSKDFESFLPKLIAFLSLLVLNKNATNSKIKEIVFKMNVALKKQELDNFQTKETIPSSKIFYENIIWSNSSKIIKYILFLYTNIYNDFGSDIDTSELQIEHILPKKWQNANFGDWNAETHSEYWEQLGNKILLPKKSNIKCCDNFFAKKQEEYKKITHITEVCNLGKRKKNKWDIEDIEQRNKEIYRGLKKFISTHSPRNYINAFRNIRILK